MPFSREEQQIIKWSMDNGKTEQETRDAVARYRTTGSPAIPGTEQPQESTKSILQRSKEFGVGAVKGLTESAVGTARLLQTVGQGTIAAIDPTKNFEQIRQETGLSSLQGADAEMIDELLKAKTPEERAGKIVAFAAELLVPTAKTGALKAGEKLSSAGRRIAGIAEDVQPAIRGGVEDVSVRLGLSVPKNEKVDKFIIDEFTRAVRPTVSGRKTSAQIDRFNKDVRSAVDTIVDNKANLELTDEFGEKIVAELPKSLDEFNKAIAQTKDNVFKQYNDLVLKAGGEGVTIDVSPIAKQLDDVISNKALRVKSPQVIDYAKSLKDRLLKESPYSAEEAQDLIKKFNSELDAFYRNPSVDAAGRAPIDAMVNNNLRKALDDVVTNATGSEYQELRSKYAALKSIEQDVAHRSVIEARKRGVGLLDYTDIFSGGEVIAGLTSLNPSLVAKGAVQKGIKEYFKFLNDPNRGIKRIFEAAEQAKNPRVSTRQLPAFSSDSDAQRDQIIEGLKKLDSQSFANSKGQINISASDEADQLIAKFEKGTDSPEDLARGRELLALRNQSGVAGAAVLSNREQEPQSNEVSGLDVAKQFPAELARNTGEAIKTGAQEIAKVPIRFGASLIDVPRILVGNEPLPPFDVKGLGTISSSQRAFIDGQVNATNELEAVASALNVSNQVILDAATVGKMAEAISKLKTPLAKMFNDFPRNTDGMIGANKATYENTVRAVRTSEPFSFDPDKMTPDLARQAFVRPERVGLVNPKDMTLTPEASVAVSHDIVGKLNAYRHGLGEAFAKIIDAKDSSYNGLVETAETLLKSFR